MSDKCLRCQVRGDCCYVNVPIEGYNIILENVRCPHLNIETGLCTTYETRHQYPWCLNDDQMFDKGCLPKGCEYLKDTQNKERNPKLHLGDILNDVKIQGFKKERVILEYMKFDSIPFEKYVEVLIPREGGKI